MNIDVKTIVLETRWERAAAKELSHYGEVFGRYDGGLEIRYPHNGFYSTRYVKNVRHSRAVLRDVTNITAYATHLKEAFMRGPLGKDEMALQGQPRFAMSGLDFMGRMRTEELGEEGIIEKCQKIRGEHGLMFRFKEVKMIPEGALIKGHIKSAKTEGTPSVTFLVKNPGNLSDDLIVLHDPGRTVLKDEKDHYTIFHALENK